MNGNEQQAKANRLRALYYVYRAMPEAQRDYLDAKSKQIAVRQVEGLGYRPDDSMLGQYDVLVARARQEIWEAELIRAFGVEIDEYLRARDAGPAKRFQPPRATKNVGDYLSTRRLEAMLLSTPQLSNSELRGYDSKPLAYKDDDWAEGRE